MTNEVHHRSRRAWPYRVTGFLALTLLLMAVGGTVVAIQLIRDAGVPEQLIVTTGTVAHQGRGNIIGEYTDVSAIGEQGGEITVVIYDTIAEVGDEVTLTYSPEDDLGNGFYQGTLGVREPAPPPSVMDKIASVAVSVAFYAGSIALFWVTMRERRAVQESRARRPKRRSPA